jgi:nucleoid DNA-binding protein
MNKRELVSAVTEVLKQNGVKKTIKMPKQRFTISDNEGNSREFTVKKSDKLVYLNMDDVTNVIDACIAVIENSLKKGESVTVHGFGSLGLHYRKARSTKRIDNGEEVAVPARYVPKFNYGNDLRLAAKIYESSLEDVFVDEIENYFEEEDDE